MLLEKCTESCGWIAAIAATVAFGSFGVPIKKVSHINVDPLVMQSYITFVCFITSWIVIPFGEKIEFSPMGILSGLFWIPSSIGGIYAIQNAGLALSVGTWCSLNVMCSFFWGIFMFEEKVKSLRATLVSLTILIVGLVGMSVYASPPPPPRKQDHMLHHGTISSSAAGTGTTSHLPQPLLVEENSTIKRRMSVDHDDDGHDDHAIDSIQNVSNKLSPGAASDEVIPISSSRATIVRTRKKKKKIAHNVFSSSSLVERKPKHWDIEWSHPAKKEYVPIPKNKNVKVCFLGGRICLTPRQLGILGAVFNGTWGSCKYIPMHYTGSKSFDGAGFLLSYACGSMLVAIFSWVLRFVFNLHHFQGKHSKAWAAMPSFHLNQLCVPGLAAGVLWSFANFCSMLAVSVLGQGLGYTLVQSSMLVSGLWGIVYGEIKGSDRIYKWFISSIITIIGISMVSYEHK